MTGSLRASISLCVSDCLSVRLVSVSQVLSRANAHTLQYCRSVPFLIFDVFYLWCVCARAHSCVFARARAQDVAPFEALRGGGLAKKLGLKNIGMLMVLLRYHRLKTIL
jgi:hypothetical protein